MNKGVLVGGGAGLLILLLLGGYWLSVRAPEPSAPLASSAASTNTSTPVAVPGAPTAPDSGSVLPGNTAPTPSGAPSSGSSDNPSAPWDTNAVNPTPSTPSPTMSREERKKVRAEVRAKMSALLAKGPNATPADTQAFLNDVERIGKGSFDPRYFSTMREMVRYSARTQELSQALTKVANSKAPADEKKRLEILSELRDLSDRFSNGAAALQSYSQETPSGKQP